MNHNRVMKLKTLNECEAMTPKQFEKYFEKYHDWAMAYGEGLGIIYNENELREGRFI